MPSVVLITRAFERLADVVSSGSRLPSLHRHVLPHPLNPLPDERVAAILRADLPSIVRCLVVGAAA